MPSPVHPRHLPLPRSCVSVILGLSHNSAPRDPFPSSFPGRPLLSELGHLPRPSCRPCCVAARPPFLSSMVPLCQALPLPCLLSSFPCSPSLVFKGQLRGVFSVTLRKQKCSGPSLSQSYASICFSSFYSFFFFLKTFKIEFVLDPTNPRSTSGMHTNERQL